MKEQDEAMNKKALKVGILTFHFANNYGAKLQTWALKKYLENLGYQAVIINYVPKNMLTYWYDLNPYRLVRRAISRLVGLKNGKTQLVLKFRRFDIIDLGLTGRAITGEDGLQAAAEALDVVIFGGDQIWNTYITKNNLPYFGTFLSGRKAVSYAVSSGNAMETAAYREGVSRYVAGFHKVSVRERDTQEFLNEHFHLQVTRVLDPVFLHSETDWKEFAEASRLKINKPYVFYYVVEENSAFEEELLKNSFINGLNIYTANSPLHNTDHRLTRQKGLAPADFLYMILHADCIYTSSFHGLAFCILFGKKAYVRTHSETGRRVINLLEECQIFWDGSTTLQIDGSQCRKSLQGRITDSKKWLRESLQSFTASTVTATYRQEEDKDGDEAAL